MKKFFLAIFFITVLTGIAEANHIKGGFFNYKYLGPGSTANTLKYEITLIVYMECFPSTGQLSQTVNFSIYNAGNNQFFSNVTVGLSNRYELGRPVDEPCITGDQSGCYYTIVEYKLNEIDLPVNLNGYTISYQRCCRIAGVENLQNSSSIGNTYSITIPGSSTPFNGQTNSSANFAINDVAVVCRNSYFTIPFEASDPDGDQLVYSFCDAWVGGSQADPAPTTASAPPYQTVPYAFPYSGTNPLGGNVTINPQTGLISGIAPNISSSGEFVLTVCVDEYRQGIKIASTRKELHIRVGTCSPITPRLDPSYITCDGYTLTFTNNNPSPEIQTYLWDFGDGNTSTLEKPTHTYADTGVYNVKVSINKGLPCSDSATTIAKVFPGFFPGFNHTGICVSKPTQFTDATTTAYGFVDSWRWDFGETAATNDTSRNQNPVYSYPTLGSKSIRLIVTNSKGCTDTISKSINIIDKPPITMAFRDTLICAGDNVQLRAGGNGIFSWTPGTNISNANTATPTVNPNTTTRYRVQLDDNGCLNTDSVNIRVVNRVTINAMADTTICTTDQLQLNVVTDGLQVLWSNAATLDDATRKNPVAKPTATTNYQVTATIGGCSATDDVLVTLVPYPIANAGADTMICYQTNAQLNGSVNGNSYSWSPAISLNNPNILSPVAFPAFTTSYILTTFANIGCPKPGRDTVVVTVLPRMNVFAGNDTAVVVGQPLQFNATGGVNYVWKPAIGLNRTNIPDPIGLYDGSIDSIRYTVIAANQAGCMDSASVTVKIYKVDPQIFVPTAFTPNGDGKNDYFKPFAVGIKKFEYFRVYNRWGQLVFSTSIPGQGWDGNIGGRTQGTNSFVWIVKGIDYLDKPFFKKGIVTLIR